MKLTTIFILFVSAVVLNTKSEASYSEEIPSWPWGEWMMREGIQNKVFRGSRINRRRSVFITSMTVESSVVDDCEFRVKVDYYLKRRFLSNKNYSTNVRIRYQWNDPSPNHDWESFCITDVIRVSGSSDYFDRVRSIIHEQPCVFAQNDRRNLLRGSPIDNVESNFLAGAIQDTASIGSIAEASAPLEPGEQVTAPLAFPQPHDKTGKNED